jgi:hypothetical protein
MEGRVKKKILVGKITTTAVNSGLLLTQMDIVIRLRIAKIINARRLRNGAHFMDMELQTSTELEQARC